MCDILRRALVNVAFFYSEVAENPPNYDGADRVFKKCLRESKLRGSRIFADFLPHLPRNAAWPADIGAYSVIVINLSGQRPHCSVLSMSSPPEASAYSPLEEQEDDDTQVPTGSADNQRPVFHVHTHEAFKVIVITGIIVGYVAFFQVSRRFYSLRMFSLFMLRVCGASKVLTCTGKKQHFFVCQVEIPHCAIAFSVARLLLLVLICGRNQFLLVFMGAQDHYGDDTGDQKQMTKHVLTA